MRHELLFEGITGDIVAAFFEVYNRLRPGYLEAVYANALAVELGLRERRVAREVAIGVSYKGVPVGHYRADLVVDGVVIVETKAGRALDPSARAQLLNYLRGTGMQVGLLLHFGPEASFHRLVATEARGSVRNRRWTGS